MCVQETFFCHGQGCRKSCTLRSVFFFFITLLSVLSSLPSEKERTLGRAGICQLKNWETVLAKSYQSIIKAFLAWSAVIFCQWWILVNGNVQGMWCLFDDSFGLK